MSVPEDGNASAAARPVLREYIEHCPGAYDMHAYCKYENPDHGFSEFPHVTDQTQTRGEALAFFRSYGWIMHRDDTATCPKCARALGLLKAAE